MADEIEKGVNLVKEEAPIVVKQYLTFISIEYWIYVGIGVFLLIISHFGFWFIGRLNKKGFIEDGIRWIPLIVFQFAGWMVICNNIFIAIKVTWFPKLFLVEKFINLL